MADYISREELRKHLKECYDNELFDADMRKVTIGIDVYVENMPAADVKPVKRGRWFHINDEGIVYCSECNNEAYWDTDYGQQLFDFCPYCGARMDGEHK